MIDTSIASALMEKEGRIPSSSDEGLSAVCICETEVIAEIERYRTALKAEADARAKAAMPKQKNPPIITREDVRAGAAAVGRFVKGAVETTGRVAGMVGIAAVVGPPIVISAANKAITDHAKTSAEKQELLLAIERFCRRNNVMDRTGFKEWVLNVDINTLTVANVPPRFMTGKRR